MYMKKQWLQTRQIYSVCLKRNVIDSNWVIKGVRLKRNINDTNPRPAYLIQASWDGGEDDLKQNNVSCLVNRVKKAIRSALILWQDLCFWNKQIPKSAAGSKGRETGAC